MKAWGIGLMVLLIGIILSTYYAYEMYTDVNDTPLTEDERKTATTIFLSGQVIALIGVAVFIYEFMKHEHKS